MIKIVTLISTLERSGLNIVIYNIAKNIDKNIFELHLITLSVETTRSMLNDFKMEGVFIHQMNLSRFQSLFFIGNKLNSIVETIKPDIIHTHSFRGSFLAKKFLSKYKRFVTIHGILKDNHSVFFGRFLGGVMAYLEVNSFKHAQERSVVSKFLSEYYSKFGEVQIIPNAVSTDIFNNPNASIIQNIRMKLNIPYDSRVFIMACDLITRKDPELVIKAFSKANIPNSLLLILGHGTLLENCKRIANSNVRFVGHVPNVSDYYKASNFFISASKSEGQGLSVLEAAMCGLKCIITDLPPHREIFENSPNQVSFFKISDEEGLMELMLSAKSKSFFMGDFFSIKEMTNKYQKVYLKLKANSFL
jgi:glycosyltransferase involved in cell wall biosynthesis